MDRDRNKNDQVTLRLRFGHWTGNVDGMASFISLSFSCPKAFGRGIAVLEEPTAIPNCALFTFSPEVIVSWYGYVWKSYNVVNHG